jgi:peroxiredoxin
MTVEVGQPAPDFTLKDQHGQDVTLSSFRGYRAVVVMFYPFAFSGICTDELSDIRDDPSAFVNDQVQLLAVSCDPMFALRAYAERDSLSYPLLSDFWPHGEVAKAYGVFDEDRGCASRGTFVVDREGRVAWKVENAIPEARDLAEQRKILADLRA